MEIIEKYDMKYDCGCVHEIALFEGGGFWKPTGNDKNCSQHS